jgi:hypothetical protein
MTSEEQAAYDRFKEMLPIDLLRLDDDLQEMPQIVQEVGEHTTRAAFARDEADLNRNQVKSVVMSQLRSNGEKKPPETQIASDVLLDLTYQKAESEYQKKSNDFAMWRTLSGSWNAKMSCISEAVRLLGMGYCTVQNITNKRREEYRKDRA